MLSVNARCSISVNSYRHILPVRGLYPPIPVSHASLSDKEVSRRKIIVFMDMPVLAYSKSSSHSSKSFFVSLDNLADLWRDALSSVRRIRFMKCRACGMMYATWLRRPTSVASVECATLPFLFKSSLIEFDHAVALSSGKEILNDLVLICHPRNMIVSARLPSAINFRTDAASGRFIGS